MVQLAIQNPTPDVPLTIAFVACSAGGDSWKNSGRERVRIRNNAVSVPQGLPVVAVAPTLTPAGGSTNMGPGDYLVAFAWGNANGETAVGPTATVTIGSGQQIAVSAIPALPTNATFAAIYVSAAPGSAVLLRAGQTATTTYSVTALPTGGAPYQLSITVTLASARLCNQGFSHPVVQAVVAGGAATELALGAVEPFRFNDAGGLAHLTYSSVGGLSVAVTT